VTISTAPQPIRKALKSGLGQVEAALICLAGLENIADVQLLMSANPGVTCLFLSPVSPPRAPMAHAIHRGGGEVVALQDGPFVIAATLIAVVAQSSRAANRS
jgi:hypothetical protein